MGTMLENLKFRVSRFLRRNEPIVLMYHGVTSFQYKLPVWTQLEIDLFEDQMQFLRESRYHVCHLAELLNYINDHKKIPENCVVVTFDDGFRNNYLEALSILEKYSIPATVFVTAGLIGTSELIWTDLLVYTLCETTVSQFSHDELGTFSLGSANETSVSLRSILQILKQVPADQKDRIVNDVIQTLLPKGVDSSSPVYQSFKLMSWAELGNLSKSKSIEIGGHTCNHNILSRLDGETAHSEILDCKSTLEKKLNTKVNLFAYPNGTTNDFSDREICSLKSTGWQAAVTTVESRVGIPIDRFRIPRIGVGSGTDSADFAYTLSGRNIWANGSFSVLPLRVLKGTLTGRC